MTFDCQDKNKIIASDKLAQEVNQLDFFDCLFSPASSNNSFFSEEKFSEQFVDQLSRQEVFNKHLFRPNTYLHKWWARRCGSTFRAILKQFVSDPKNRNYYSSGGLNGKIVFDPMMGGGTTLHEAIRLGANVIGADIDPIPVIQARASLSHVNFQDLQNTFDELFHKLYNNLEDFFKTECPTCQKSVDLQYMLYGLRKYCKCGEFIQVDQYDLRHEADRTISICPNTGKIVETYNSPFVFGREKQLRLITKKDKVCPCCKQVYQEFLDLPYYSRYVPIVVVGTCPMHGLFFRSPSNLDLLRLKQADERRLSLDFIHSESFTVKKGPKSKDLLKRNITSYTELFSSRQLLYLEEAIQNIQSYNGVIKLNLGLLISTSLEFNSLLCGYKGWFKRRPGAIRHVFALHAYCFPYTALENNPINCQKFSGNLQQLFNDRIERGRKWAELPVERKIKKDKKTELVRIVGELDSGIEVYAQSEFKNENQQFLLFHANSQKLPIKDNSVDLVITDPPYYDSIQYSDLANFFRVWLNLLLPNEINWSYDEKNSAVAIKTDEDISQFMTNLSRIFTECARTLKTNTGRMAFTFHHWNPTAWAELTISLKQAGFVLIDFYVVFSEHPISVHINHLRSIKHDSILIFTQADDNSSTSWELPQFIRMDDSESFCRDCSQTLGWLLSNNPSESQIQNIWNQLIQRKGK